MAIYPESGLDDRVPAFLEQLLRCTDDPKATEEYIALFTPDALFKCGRLKLTGTEGWCSSTILI